MSALPKPPTARGWCPGVRRPMETGDGLLVRVHPPGGVLTAAQARLVAEAARAHGNGLLDVTGRGNVQIRGVSPETYDALLARLDAAGLAGPETDGPPGLALVSPLAGIDPGARFDARALTRRLEPLAEIPGLPPKLFAAVDDGGLMPAAGAGADVIVTADVFLPRQGRGRGTAGGGGGGSADGTRFVAEHPPGTSNRPLHHASHGPPPPRLAGEEHAAPPHIAIALASPDGPLRIGTCPIEEAPAAIEAILRAFAAMRLGGRTGAGRIRDLDADLVRELVEAALAAGLADGAPRRHPTLPSPEGRDELDAEPRLPTAPGTAPGQGLGRSPSRQGREGWGVRRDSGDPFPAGEVGPPDGGSSAEQRRPESPAPRAGLIPLSPRRTALLAALPFGRCTADQLALAAEWSELHGSGEVRPSFTRGLLIPGLPAEEASAIAQDAEAAGFIVDPDDPRLHVSACPGAPACASAASPAPADAALLAEAARELIAAGASLHVSGCPKGCAHPAQADLTLVGASDGCYGVVLRGTARDPATARLPLTEIVQLLSAHPSPDALARAVRP